MFFKVNMNIDESLFNTGPYYHVPLKRKRFPDYESNFNSDEDEDSSNDGPEPVSSFNSNISLSPFLNIVRNGRKVMITAKTSTNSNSQIEVDMDNVDSPISSIEQEHDNAEFNLSSEEEASNECDTGLVFSDTLKTKLEEFKNENNLIDRLKSETDFYPNNNELQIIPWIPNKPQSDEYSVEEPYEENFSSQNKPLIQEVFSSDNSNKNYKCCANAFSNFYLVEHEDEYKAFDCSNQNSSSYNITELENHFLPNVKNQTGDESMEF